MYGVAIIGIMLAVARRAVLDLPRPVLHAEGRLPRCRPRWPPARHRSMAAPTPAAPLLKVDGLSRSFGGLRAVSDVSFEVTAGEILGIIGPNGAGKTTLFNLLNGVLPADEGSAMLGGESMLGKKVHQVCRMGVGRTFQVVRSFPRLPLLDNVIVGAYGAGFADADGDRLGRACAGARRAGGQGGRRRRATDQQATAADGTGPRAGRLAAAAAAGRDAGRAGPRGMRRRAGRAACACAREGMTVVIIEHTMHAMMRIADRFVVLDHGRVLASGLPRQVVEDRSVIEAYLGKKWAAKQDA